VLRCSNLDTTSFAIYQSSSSLQSQTARSLSCPPTVSQTRPTDASGPFGRSRLKKAYRTYCTNSFSSATRYATASQLPAPAAVTPVRTPDWIENALDDEPWREIQQHEVDIPGRCLLGGERRCSWLCVQGTSWRGAGSFLKSRFNVHHSFLLRLGLDCMRRSMQKWRTASMSSETLDVHPSQCKPSAFASRPSTIRVGKGFSWGVSLAFSTDLLPDLASVSFISSSPCALPRRRPTACCFTVPSLSLTPDSARTPQAMASHTPLRPTPRHGWTPMPTAGKMHMPRPSPSSPR
jgi:hypothetical protein